MAAQIEAKFQEGVKAFEGMQKELSKMVSNRQILESQLKENESVKKELELLDDDAQVYKLMGPVLLPQEKDEAKTSVKKRLEYITGEMERAEKKIKDLNSSMEAKRMELITIQKQLQERSAAPA